MVASFGFLESVFLDLVTLKELWGAITTSRRVYFVILIFVLMSVDC